MSETYTYWKERVCDHLEELGSSRPEELISDIDEELRDAQACGYTPEEYARMLWWETQ